MVEIKRNVAIQAQPRVKGLAWCSGVALKRSARQRVCVGALETSAESSVCVASPREACALGKTSPSESLFPINTRSALCLNRLCLSAKKSGFLITCPSFDSVKVKRSLDSGKYETEAKPGTFRGCSMLEQRSLCTFCVIFQNLQDLACSIRGWLLNGDAWR